jgi:hypothetical protein
LRPWASHPSICRRCSPPHSALSTCFPYFSFRNSIRDPLRSFPAVLIACRGLLEIEPMGRNLALRTPGKAPGVSRKPAAPAALHSRSRHKIHDHRKGKRGTDQAARVHIPPSRSHPHSKSARSLPHTPRLRPPSLTDTQTHGRLPWWVARAPGRARCWRAWSVTTFSRAARAS